MYFVFRENVNAAIVGFGRRWLLFIETPEGMRMSGAFTSTDAALAAIGGC